MGNLIALILVVLVIVMGIGAVFAITANGAATTPATDTFGDTASPDTIAHNNQSSGLAVASMPVMFIVFFIMICVVLVAAVVWLWKTGKSKSSGY